MRRVAPPPKAPRKPDEITPKPGARVWTTLRADSPDVPICTL
jgi:hypothetical protein